MFSAGFAIFLLPLSAAILQIVFGRVAPWVAATVGGLVLIVGVVLLILAGTTASPSLFIIATVFAGAGFGVTFLGGLRTLSAAVPHEHRAAVTSAFYVVAYLSLSIPAIVAGFMTSGIGLVPTFTILGIIVAIIAAVVSSESIRTRPDQAAIAATENEVI